MIVFMIGLHWAALAFLRFPFWEFIGPLMLLAALLPYERLRLMSVLNLAFALITGSLISVSTPTTGDFNVVWPPPWVVYPKSWLVYPAILISFTALYFALFKIFSRLKAIRSPVSVGLAILAVLTFAVHQLESETAARAVTIGLIFALTRAFWGMCYQLSETDLLKKIPFAVHLGTLNSPWQSGWASNVIVRGYSDYANTAVSDPERLRRVRMSGLKLALYAAVLQFLADQFSYYFFNTYFRSPFSEWTGFDFSTTGFLSRSLPRPYAWLFILCTMIHFMLSLTAFTHAAVSIARTCGFEVWRNVYRPLEATSFLNFLSRIYFYYIAVLQRFFFYPTWRLLRGIHHRQLRTGTTMLLTIFVGGMVTSLLRYLPFHFESLTELWIILESRIAYFALLGILCAISAYSPKWPSFAEKPALLRLRGLWYCFLYALCYSAQLRTPDYEGFSGVKNLAWLFGF